MTEQTRAQFQHLKTNLLLGIEELETKLEDYKGRLEQLESELSQEDKEYYHKIWWEGLSPFQQQVVLSIREQSKRWTEMINPYYVSPGLSLRIKLPHSYSSKPPESTS